MAEQREHSGDVRTFHSGTLVPVPDPTTLTTEQLYREVEALREYCDQKVNASQRFNSEKFRRVFSIFRERQGQATQRHNDSKTALDAALQSQKESAGKMEAAFTKQIDSTNVWVDDLRGRIILIEGRDKGKTGENAERHSSTASVVGIVGAVVGVMSLIVAGVVAAVVVARH
jgi:hypothetical protein